MMRFSDEGDFVWARHVNYGCTEDAMELSPDESSIAGIFYSDNGSDDFIYQLSTAFGGVIAS